MRAYELWLEGTAELELLYLLGLFDQPIEKDVLTALAREREESAWQSISRMRRSGFYQLMELNWWQRLKRSYAITTSQQAGVENLTNLTKNIRDSEVGFLQRTLKQLQELGLLSEYDNDPSRLDCHPLIREYFGSQLKKQHPEAW